MRVLLTGHEGYLGTVMAPALVGAGHDVVGLDTRVLPWVRPRTSSSPSSRRQDIDLHDVSAEHLRGIDAVVHLPTLSNDAVGNLKPSITYEMNIHAALRPRLARDAGVSRFLFASSCSIYGASPEDELVTENAPMRPLTPYAESKVHVEDSLHKLADASFSPIYLRSATAYGWSPRLRLDLVVNDLVASALFTGEVHVLSDGTPWRPVIHAQDIAGAFAAALDAPRETVHDRAFNVGFSGDEPPGT